MLEDCDCGKLHDFQLVQLEKREEKRCGKNRWALVAGRTNNACRPVVK